MSKQLFSFFLSIAFISMMLSCGVSEALRPKWHQLTQSYSFSNYLQDFGKKYSSHQEYIYRKFLFQAELENVLSHNSQKYFSWKMGINQFSDWTMEEKNVILHGSRFNAQEESSKYKKPFPRDGHKASPASMFPKTKDWRAHVPSVLTAVKDQGNCGDCWAHAATEAMESAWALATGDLFVLSQQQVTSCVPRRGLCYSCNGSNPHWGYEYVAEAGGIGEEWVYPFTSYNGSFPKCEDVEKLNSPAKKVVNVSGYYRIDPNNENATIQALNELGPLAVDVNAFPWIPYETGILDNCAIKNISMFNKTWQYSTDHSVMLVGYGRDEGLDKNYWVIRNSWNPAWGENGFIRLHREATTPCGWSWGGSGCHANTSSVNTWVCGCSALLWHPTFPIVKL